MADHSETVIDAIVAAVAAISTGGGASFTPAVAERHDRYQSTKGPLPNIQVFRGNYRLSREEFGGNWRIDLFVDVWLLIQADKTGATPTDKQVNLAYSDVVAAVVAIDWDAVDATLVAVDSTPLITENEDDPDDGVIITFQVQYKLEFGDLNNAIDPS
jgi:hypothetical protein